MNLTLRKLALLEKSMLQREEEAKIAGYTTSPVDKEFQEKISRLMDKVRTI